MRNFCLAFAAAILFSGCQRKPEPDLPPLSASTISGEALWKRITVEADFNAYAFWPEHEGMRSGQSPHGKYHEIYINRTLRSVLPAAGRTAPDGSIVVKRNFGPDRKVKNYTLMAKAAGYDPAHGDWFWAMYDPAGKVTAQGKPSGCIACHEGMKDNDYLIVRALDAPVPASR